MFADDGPRPALALARLDGPARSERDRTPTRGVLATTGAR